MANDQKLGEFEQLVLLALVRLGVNAYGVSIRQEISKRCGRDVSVGAAYTTLSRLENKGFVKSKVGESTAERGGRAKKYFLITAAGQKALDRSLNAIQQLGIVGSLAGTMA